MATPVESKKNKRRILFVDDEPNVLQGLQRMLRSMRHDWDMLFTESGQAALDLLATKPADVIVSDMRMPGMDGAQLLNEVKIRYPHTIRIILSGQSEQEKILRSIGPTHRYLSKPCDPELLKQTIESTCQLHQTFQDPTLIQIVSNMESVPSLPTLYEEVMKEVETPTSSLERIGQIIAKDMGMTAQILKIANSAYFGPQRQVSNPLQAVYLLGSDLLLTLILYTHVFSKASCEQVQGFSLDRAWQHSSTTASFARMIALDETNDQWMQEDAFSAGLLHDIGKLVLATNLPQKYQDVLTLAQKEDIPHWQAEQQIFGTTHMDVGAYLLGLWGLPDPIIEALAYHHRPSQNPQQQFTPLTAVHIADGLEKEEGSDGAPRSHSKLDLEYLDRLGLSSRLSRWEVAQ